MRTEWLHLNTGTSLLHWLLLLFIFGLTLFAILTNSLIKGEAQGLLLALTLLSARHWLDMQKPVTLICHGNSWQVDQGAGPFPVQLCSPVFVGYWFTVLKFKPEQTGSRVSTLVLGRDSIPPDQYRKLRVLLQHRNLAE